ncbi:hypothetical protein [Sulfurimonas sp.]|nr:hypothetical protein [Sulfurimonas sp.]
MAQIGQDSFEFLQHQFQFTDDAKQKRYYLEEAALSGYRAAYKELAVS